MGEINSPVFIISIPSSKDRVENALARLSLQGRRAHVVEKTRMIFTIKWRRVKYSYYDQYKKYIFIFREIAKINRPCLVLEDDALAIDRWELALSSAPKDFDFLFLSDDRFPHPINKVDNQWYECRWSKTTCATVFSPRAAKALLRWQFICKHPMDWTINYLLKQEKHLKSYWHIPGIFEHGTVKGIYQSSIF